jgi:murein L,D-transpeptidase YafK
MKQIVVVAFLFILIVVLFANINFNSLPKNTEIDGLVVYKSERKLVAFSKGKRIKTYSIALGKSPTGAKQFQGDNKTPEGVYFINGKNEHSIAYKNLGISYPNAKDKSNSKGKPTGGDIKIHGLMNYLWFIGNFHGLSDWTNGCIAVNNFEMDELYNSVIIGTRIEIRP